LKVRVSVLTPDGDVEVSTDDSSSIDFETVVVGEGVVDTVLVGASAELAPLSFAPLLFAPEHPTAIKTRQIRPENKYTLLCTFRLLKFSFA